jgi:hypothetical protein
MISEPVEPDFLGLAIRSPDTSQLFNLLFRTTAPESSIIYTELKPCLSLLNSRIKVSVIRVSTRLQISTIWLYRSLLVIRPIVIAIPHFINFRFCCYPVILLLSSGMIRSLMLKDKPPWKAVRNPKLLDIIEELGRFRNIGNLDDITNDLTKVLSL